TGESITFKPSVGSQQLLNNLQSQATTAKNNLDSATSQLQTAQANASSGSAAVAKDQSDCNTDMKNLDKTKLQDLEEELAYISGNKESITIQCGTLSVTVSSKTPQDPGSDTKKDINNAINNLTSTVTSDQNQLNSDQNKYNSAAGNIGSL